MQKIRIFLASSNELKVDRMAFESLISEKNNHWEKEGKPQIILELWEYQTETMSPTRSQDEYNKIIRETDIFVMLFWTKVGKYTYEEFNLAKQLFHTTEKPQVIIYQKVATPDKQEQSLKDFISSLIANPQDEYFCGQYEHIDTLKFKIYKELDFYYKKYFLPKTHTEMLATTLFAGLLTTYQSGAVELLKSIGLGVATDIAKDTLKNLGEKVITYFKGKKEEDVFDALENAVTKQNAEKFKAKSENVLELLKTTVENDADFRKEVESILQTLDSEKQNELAKAVGQMVSNVANIRGHNNKVYQGISNSTITDNSVNINQKNKDGDNIVGSDFLEKWLKKDK
jgi:hypothetical protein